MGNKLFNRYVTKERIEEAQNEPITNDGGLGDIGREIQEKIKNGEFENLSNKELMQYYMSMVELSGNQKLINAARLAVMKKNRSQLQQLVKSTSQTAIMFSKKD